MSKAPRPILAAGSSSGQSTTNDTAMGSGQDPSRSLGGRPKRTLIESACRACRKRKSRCDGARPTCSRCQSLRTDCIYEAEEGESRWSALKRRNQTLEAERDELLDVLTQLRSRPQSEAQDMLERIRRSSSSELPSVLREAVGSGATNPSQRASSDASSETRLPGIQTMFDVAGAERTERSSAGPPGNRGPTRQRSIGSDGSGDSYMSYSSTHSALERSGSQSSKP